MQFHYEISPVLIGIFDILEPLEFLTHYFLWVFIHDVRNLSDIIDISSLGNDTEMADQSMIREFPGASYELCYFLMKDRKQLLLLNN